MVIKEVYRESTLRFFSEGYDVHRVLIYLLSSILQRQGSWLCILSITMTVMSPRVWPSPLKCSTIGDFAVHLCAMLNNIYWPCNVAAVQSRPHTAGHTSCKLLDKWCWRTYRRQQNSFYTPGWLYGWWIHPRQSILDTSYIQQLQRIIARDSWLLAVRVTWIKKSLKFFRWQN